MTLRVKLFILLALAGVIPLVYSSGANTLGLLGFIVQVFKVSGTLVAIVLVYTFYGWRMPVLKLCASAPNIRGTWLIEDGEVHDVRNPKRTSSKPKAYVVLRQSDSQIRLQLLWDDGTKQVDELIADTPAIFHQGKYAFAGTYMSQPEGKEHAVGAFIQYSNQAPRMFNLLYRTDEGFTGKLIAKERKLRHFPNLEKAQKGYDKKIDFLGRGWFALKLR